MTFDGEVRVFFTKDMRVFGALFTVYLACTSDYMPLNALFLCGYFFFIIVYKKNFFFFLEKKVPEIAPYVYSLGWIPFLIYICDIIFLHLYLCVENYLCPSLEIRDLYIIHSFRNSFVFWIIFLSLVFQFLKKTSYENKEPVKYFFPKHFSLLLLSSAYFWFSFLDIFSSPFLCFLLGLRGE